MALITLPFPHELRCLHSRGWQKQSLTWRQCWDRRSQSMFRALGTSCPSDSQPESRQICILASSILYLTNTEHFPRPGISVYSRAFLIQNAAVLYCRSDHSCCKHFHTRAWLCFLYHLWNWMGLTDTEFLSFSLNIVGFKQCITSLKVWYNPPYCKQNNRRPVKKITCLFSFSSLGKASLSSICHSHSCKQFVGMCQIMK